MIRARLLDLEQKVSQFAVCVLGIGELVIGYWLCLQFACCLVLVLFVVGLFSLCVLFVTMCAVYFVCVCSLHCVCMCNIPCSLHCICLQFASCLFAPTIMCSCVYICMYHMYSYHVSYMFIPCIMCVHIMYHVCSYHVTFN